MRKYYIDNLRWSAIAMLIVYHAAMAWNTWGEPNYIFFEGNAVISAVVVFFSPFLMPLLFVLAGISTKYALRKRTVKQYLTERVKKLIIPFVFGVVVFMPIMTYLADRFNCGYRGTFIQHYGVFFTKLTDMTGADGGFSVGQFWFLLYLFIISVIFIAILKFVQKTSPAKRERHIKFPYICLAGLPLLLLHELLSVGGKSLPEYLYLFLLGYYVLSDDNAVDELSRNKWLLLIVGIVSDVLTVYLLLWADQSVVAFTVICAITRTAAEWFMVLEVTGTANSFWNKESKLTEYMSQRSFMFYIFHFVWIVLFQYLLSGVFPGSTFLLYIVPVLLAYAAAFLSCEICIRIPFLCFLMGTKPIK